MRHILTLGFLLIGITLFGQEYEFDIHNTSLDEYIQIEEKLGSKKIPTTSNHISFSGNAQPIKYKRNQKVIPDLVSYYYFKEKDSIMSYVLYEWDESRQTEKVNLNDKKSKKFQRKLIRKFKKLEKKITKLYGKPLSEGDISNLKQANEKGGLEKNNKWYPNESTEIEMYIVVSNYFQKKGMITITPTHRIRLYVRKMK